MVEPVAESSHKLLSEFVSNNFIECDTTDQRNEMIEHVHVVSSNPFQKFFSAGMVLSKLDHKTNITENTILKQIPHPLRFLIFQMKDAVKNTVCYVLKSPRGKTTQRILLEKRYQKLKTEMESDDSLNQYSLPAWNTVKKVFRLFPSSYLLVHFPLL